MYHAFATKEYFQFQTKFQQLVTQTGVAALNIEPRFTVYLPFAFKSENRDER